MPEVVVLAGPNGAGKSTAAPIVLQEALAVSKFVNADVIARGLSAFAPEREAVRAGRIMLNQIHALADRGESFAFETTLASRGFVPWLKKLKGQGYTCHLVFLWLNDERLAISRVKTRVEMGGHDIPKAIIRRRYHAGISIFFNLYRPIVDGWRFYDNSLPSNPLLVANYWGGELVVEENALWSQLESNYAKF